MQRFPIRNPLLRSICVLLISCGSFSVTFPIYPVPSSPILLQTQAINVESIFSGRLLRFATVRHLLSKVVLRLLTEHKFKRRYRPMKKELFRFPNLLAKPLVLINGQGLVWPEVSVAVPWFMSEILNESNANEAAEGTAESELRKGSRQDILRCLQQLAQIDPRRYWRTAEIQKKLSESGSDYPIHVLWYQCQNLARDRKNTHVQERLHGKEKEYIWLNASVLADRENRATWNDMFIDRLETRKRLADGVSEKIMEYLWSAEGARLRIRQYASAYRIPRYEAEKELGEIVIEELLDVYETLQQSHEVSVEVRKLVSKKGGVKNLEWIIGRLEGHSISSFLFRQRKYWHGKDQAIGTLLSEWLAVPVALLLQDLRLLRKTCVIEDEQTLIKGLRWLDAAGFPIRQEGHQWQVTGLAGDRFYQVHPDSWSRSAAEDWVRLRKPADRTHLIDHLLYETPTLDAALRIRAIEDAIGISWTSEILPKWPAVRQVWHNWLKKNRTKEEISDQTFEMWGSVLGLEPVLLRTGWSRSELLDYVSPLLPTLSLSNRLKLLRKIAGLSQLTVAAKLGIRRVLFRTIELRDTVEVTDPTIWANLANLLGLDPILLLTGYPERHLLMYLDTLESSRREQFLLTLIQCGEVYRWPNLASRLGVPLFTLITGKPLANDDAFLKDLTVPKRVQLLRFMAGWTEEELASRSGLHVRDIRLIEKKSDFAFIEAHVWPKVAKALEIDPFILLCGESRAPALNSRDRGQRILILRLIQGKSLYEVAAETNSFYATVWSWEGGTMPGLKYRALLVRALGSTAEELFDNPLALLDDTLQKIVSNPGLLDAAEKNQLTMHQFRDAPPPTRQSLVVRDFRGLERDGVFVRKTFEIKQTPHRFGLTEVGRKIIAPFVEMIRARTMSPGIHHLAVRASC